MSEAAAPYLPLTGIKVLDLSRLIVGGLATRQLADLGAEVVKVEDPTTGDYLRTVAPFLDGEGVWHNLLNRNKKSIALDITDPEDRATIERLAMAADVVVDVSRPGALVKLGLDLGELRRQHPHLVVCSITAFGQTGPWAMIPAHGLNMDSLGSTVATKLDERGIPRFVQLVYSGLSQEGPSMQAALAITAALLGVKATGEGAWIDISCWDALIEMNRTAVAYQAVTGADPRDAEKHMWGAKHRIYPAGDGKYVFLAVIEQKFWDRFCRAIDRDDLLPSWKADGQVDYGGSPELEAELESIMASRTAEQWGEFFVQHGLPGSPLLTLEETMASEHFRVRDMLERDTGRAVPNVASPIRFIDKAVDRPGRHAAPAPAVGAHTAEVLGSWLGDD